ncbi:MAG TPA: hypothetical protein VLU46_05720 [Thermoanaerobaculia bacterium]|nr:hypothetical protein [Thermoanaerobaculia bacterium]
MRHRLLPWPVFLRRAAIHAVIAFGGVIAAVAIGTVGYHLLGPLPWVDAFLNASMILSGMGPVDKLETSAAKIFAACYALFSGLLFIALMGLVLAPWAHRVLHKMHLDEEDTTTPSDREKR